MKQTHTRFSPEVIGKAYAIAGYLQQTYKDDYNAMYLFVRNIVMTKFVETEEFASHTSCGDGCSFCCHDKIFMGNTEAAIIRKKMLEKKSYFNQVRASLQKLEDKGEKILFVDKACPALLDPNEEGKRLCGIYEFRPLICAMHSSIEESEKCNKEGPDGFKIEKIIMEAFSNEIDSLVIALQLLESERSPSKEPSIESSNVAMHNILD